jgi:cytochrome c-type biogenesis protein
MIGDVTTGLQAWWAPGLAFAAGVVSFASPCVLPLVPGYLSFVTGGEAGVRKDGGRAEPLAVATPAATAGHVSTTTVAAETKPTRTHILPIVLFILGFSTVFTIVGGFTATALIRWLRSTTGQRAAGAVVLGFGLFMILYALRVGVPALYREERPLLSRIRPGPAGAFPLGAAFAIGWTPCIGPVLGAILTLAAGQGSTGRAMLLLFCYSLGLGLPFFLVGVGVGRFLGALRVFTRNYHWFAGISGIVLAAIGVLLISGRWTLWMAPLFRFITRFQPAI